MRTPSYISQWSEQRCNHGWWPFGGSHADVLEMGELCAPGSTIGISIRVDRWHSLLLELCHSGGLRAPTYYSVDTPVEADPNETARCAEAILRLEFVPANAAGMHEQRLIRSIAELVQATAGIESWAGLLRLANEQPPESPRAAFYLALIAANAKQADAVRDWLRVAAELSGEGSAASTGYLRSLAAECWRHAEYEPALRLISTAFRADQGRQQWEILEDLVAMTSADQPGPPAFQAARTARDLLVEHLVSVGSFHGGRLSLVRHIFGTAFDAMVATEDWAAVLAHWKEARSIFMDVDNALWVHEDRVRALVHLGRVDEAFEALEMQIQERPEHVGPLVQKLRLDALDLAAAQGGAALRFLQQPPPEGLRFSSRAAAVTRAADHLQAADMHLAAVALVSGEIDRFRDGEPQYVYELARYVANAVMSDEAILKHWSTLYDQLMGLGVHSPESFPPLVTRAIQLVEQQDIEAAAESLVRALRAVQGEATEIVVSAEFRGLVARVVREARRQDFDLVAAELLNCMIMFGAPPLESIPPDQQALHQVEWAETLILDHKYREAMEAASLGLKLPEERLHSSSRTALLRAWFSAHAKREKRFDTAELGLLDEFERSLTECNDLDALVMCRLLRARALSTAAPRQALEIFVAVAPTASSQDAYPELVLHTAWLITTDQHPEAQRWAGAVLSIPASAFSGPKGRFRLASLRCEAEATLGNWVAAEEELRRAQEGLDRSGEAEMGEALLLNLFDAFARCGRTSPADALQLFESALSWQASQHTTGIVDPGGLLPKLRLILGVPADHEPFADPLSANSVPDGRASDSSDARLAVDTSLEQRRSQMTGLILLVLDSLPSLQRPQPIAYEPPNRVNDLNYQLLLSKLLSQLGEVAQAGGNDSAEIAQELTLARMLMSQSPYDPDASEQWKPLLDQWKEPPLSWISAQILATVATSCGEHALAAEMLGIAARFAEHGSARYRNDLRVRAGSLVRAGMPTDAIDLLADTFLECAEQGREAPGADGSEFLWLSELLRTSELLREDPATSLYAAKAAQQAWLRVARSGEIPSPEPQLGKLTRANVDYSVRVLSLRTIAFTAPQLDHFELMSQQFADLRRLYPEHPMSSWAFAREAVALASLDRNVEALLVIDRLFQAEATEPDLETGKLRNSMLASITRDETGAVEALSALPPPGLALTQALRSLQIAAYRLDEWGHTERAAELMLEMAQQPRYREGAAAPFAFEGFISDRMEHEVWRDVVDTVLAAPVGFFDERIVRDLRFRRAQNRARLGDLAGAVDDALCYSHGDDGVSRRNARVLLRAAASWAQQLEDHPDALTRVNDRELEIGAPPSVSEGEEADEGYVRELGMWANALSGMGHAAEALRVRIDAVVAATALGDEELLTAAIEAELKLQAQSANFAGMVRVQRTSELLEALGEFRAAGTRAQLLWHRAYGYSRASDMHHALEVVDLALDHAHREDLPDHRMLDVIKLASDALEWSEVPVSRQRMVAGQVLRAAADFSPKHRPFQVVSLLRQSRAHTLLRDGAQARACVIAATSLLGSEGQAEDREEVCQELQRIIESGLLDLRASADLAGSVWRWYVSGSVVDRVRWAMWTANCGLRVDDYDLVVQVCESVIGSQPEGDMKLAGFLVESAHAASFVGKIDSAQRLLDLACQFPGELPTLLRCATEITKLRVLFLESRLDECFLKFSEQLADVARESDGAVRLHVSFMLLILGDEIGVEGRDLSVLKTMVREDIQAGFPLPTHFPTLLINHILERHGLPTEPATSALSLPNPALLSASELLIRVNEQSRRWHPGQALSDQVFDWVGSIRELEISSSLGGLVTMLARSLWAEMALRQAEYLAAKVLTERGDQAAADKVRDSLARAAIASAQSCVEYFKEGSSQAALHLLPSAMCTMWIATDELSDPSEGERVERWILPHAIAWALRIDARAAASTDLERRQTLLSSSELMWELSFEIARSLGDHRSLTEIIVVRRSSLVLDTAENEALSGTPVALSRPHLSEVYEPSFEPLDGPVSPSEAFASAASPALITGVASASAIAVRPRPLVRMPDGNIALESMCERFGAPGVDQFFTPTVIDLL